MNWQAGALVLIGGVIGAAPFAVAFRYALHHPTRPKTGKQSKEKPSSDAKP